MVDLTGAVQIATIVVLALLAVALLRYLLEGVSKDRLMRCPETGAVAFIGAERVSRPEGGAPAVVVRACEFWPERKDCAQGCLARYHETEAGYRVRLDALRPFEGPNVSGDWK